MMRHCEKRHFEFMLLQYNMKRSSHFEQSTSLCDTKFKLVFLGDMGVGKTSIIDRFIRDEFDPTNNPTVGIDFLSRNFTLDHATYRLQLWDTAGQQKYKSLVPAYLRDANAAIFVYDITRKQSLTNVTSWLQLYRENQGEQSRTCLVGSKADLLAQTNPLREEAELLAQREDMLYCEVSAKTGAGVGKLFTEMVRRLTLERKPSEQQVQTERVVLKLGAAGEEQGRCCYI